MATLTKATITGSELPTGDQYCYTKDVVDQGNYILKLVYAANQLVLYKQLIVPMPPTSFTENLVILRTWSWVGTAPTTLTLPRSVGSAYNLYYQYFPVLFNGFYSLLDFGSSSAQLPTDNTDTPSVFTTVGTSTTSSELLQGLGTKNGTIRTTLSHNVYGTKTVNVNNVDISGNSILSYGTYIVANSAVFVLLKKSGMMWQFITNAYYQLTVPSGGEIKQFANGYYIATNAGGDMFLYNINNNGTLMAQLTGTYDPSLSLELMTVI